MGDKGVKWGVTNIGSHRGVIYLVFLSVPFGLWVSLKRYP